MSDQKLFKMLQDRKNAKAKSRLSDLAIRVGLLLLLPYVMWLSQYNDAYVKTIHNKQIHFNFDSIMLSFHDLFSNANMIVHEAGHGICYILHCPQFFSTLNGTLFQLALPLIFIFLLLQKREQNTYWIRCYMVCSKLSVCCLVYVTFADTKSLSIFFRRKWNT